MLIVVSCTVMLVHGDSAHKQHAMLSCTEGWRSACPLLHGKGQRRTCGGVHPQVLLPSASGRPAG